MSDVVLDASAVLAVLQGEPGADVVTEALRHAAISAVNLSEVVTRLIDKGVPELDIRASIQRLGLEVAPFDTEQAFDGGLPPEALGCLWAIEVAWHWREGSVYPY